MPRFEVEERIFAAVAPERIRGTVRDFRQWEPWSPWLTAEPDCPLEYTADGKSYLWDGKVIGSGQMELIREEESALYYKLVFFKPWKSESTVDFQFDKKDGGTEIAWRMQGALPFFMFWMKKMMRSWIGSDYRRGLAKLKDYVESGSVPSRVEFLGVDKGLVSSYIGLRSQCEIASLGTDMPKRYQRLHEWMAANEVVAAGKPLAIYHKFDMVKQTTDYTAAIPVGEIPGQVPGDFVASQLEVPRSYQLKHTGAYRHLGSAWSAGMMHERSKAFRRDKSRDSFEVYVTDPMSGVSEAELVTKIHFPAR